MGRRRTRVFLDGGFRANPGRLRRLRRFEALRICSRGFAGHSANKIWRGLLWPHGTLDKTVAPFPDCRRPHSR